MKLSKRLNCAVKLENPKGNGYTFLSLLRPGIPPPKTKSPPLETGAITKGAGVRERNTDYILPTAPPFVSLYAGGSARRKNFICSLLRMTSLSLK